MSQEYYKTGNFEFVRHLYPDICDKLQEAERKVYTDCLIAGITLRGVMEAWAETLVEQYGVTFEAMKPKQPVVADKIKELQNRKLVPIIKKKREFETEQKGLQQQDVYNSWRWFGNDCAHQDGVPQPQWPKKTTKNALNVLKGIYDIFKEEYRNRFGNGEADRIPPFDPYIIPFDTSSVGTHYVLRSYKPLDADVTRCLREFETCTFNNDNNRFESYGIVRMYRKENMDEKVLHLRDREAFAEAELEAGIGFDGNVQVHTIADMKHPFNDNYIVLYRFTKKPMQLNDRMLETLSMDVRQALCVKLADIMNNFHTLPAPIYHRNLSCDSVFLCDGRDGVPVPSVIKLDCAKIESEEFGTVMVNVKDMKERMQQQKIIKYTAPEVRMYLQRGQGNVLWDKADVWSLGVLFGDIISGAINVNPVKSATLQRSGAKIELVQMIDKMCHPKAELRPSMETVAEALRELG